MAGINILYHVVLASDGFNLNFITSLRTRDPDRLATSRPSASTSKRNGAFQASSS